MCVCLWLYTFAVARCCHMLCTVLCGFCCSSTVAQGCFIPVVLCYEWLRAVSFSHSCSQWSSADVNQHCRVQPPCFCVLCCVFLACPHCNFYSAIAGVVQTLCDSCSVTSSCSGPTATGSGSSESWQCCQLSSRGKGGSFRSRG